MPRSLPGPPPPPPPRGKTFARAEARLALVDPKPTVEVRANERPLTGKTCVGGHGGRH